MPSLRKDDVALFYREAPGTVPAIVLVHGWCCDHTYFDPQFDHFAARGHRVIAPDLRGHGWSDKPEGRYSMQFFADALAWLCGELGLVRPVLIGHSMGGVVVFDLAARYPDLTSAIVMLDAAVVLPESARAGLLQFIEGCVRPATAMWCATTWPTFSLSRQTTPDAKRASSMTWSRLQGR
jgi:pimeloyl-ACP methyl ester carboxylesterase